MNNITNIEVKKEEIPTKNDFYNDIRTECVQMNNDKIKTDTKSKFFHELKSEYETEMQVSSLKDYSFEECRVCGSVFPNK